MKSLFEDASNDSALRQKALEVHQTLCQEYGCPIAFFHNHDPLSELISSLLSHRTRNRESGQAFKALKARYASWEELMNAPQEEVEQTISAVTWPEQKAPRIQGSLRFIQEKTGALSLDFLAQMSPTEAQKWLEAIPGVGPKTSAAVLLFSSLRRPALPVDSHHHRVAQRLGLLPPNVEVGASHALLRAQLPSDWDAQQLYDNHEALMLHGQKCCFFHRPDCQRCVVLSMCPFGQARMEKTGERDQVEGEKTNRAA